MKSFLTACGATGPLVIDLLGPGRASAERRLFFQPFVLIGRDGSADVVLDHDLVSRRHAYLQVIHGRLFWVDLDSRSGTVGPDGQAESGWLDPGQLLRIGPYELRLTAPVGEPAAGSRDDATRPAINPLLARWAETDDLPRVWLEFKSRTAGSSNWRMSQVLAVVGSSPRCRVRLLDSGVSKRHCALLRTPRGLWVVDLLGRAGITVNAETVRFACLGPGDSLGLGQVTVRPNFEPDPSSVISWGSGPGPGEITPFVQAPNLPVRQTRLWGQMAVPGSDELAPVSPGSFPNVSLPQAPTFASGDPAMSQLLTHFSQMQQQMIDQFQQSMMMMLQMFGGMHRDQMGLVREELNRLRDLNLEIEKIKADLANRPESMPAPAAALPATPPSPAFSMRPSRTDAAQPAHDPLGAGPNPGASKNASAPDIHDWISERLAAISQEQQSRWQKVMYLLKGGQSL